MNTSTGMKAMLLAAGEGTRLRPLTRNRPKPMLPVAGRPVMEWILLWLRSHGVRTAGVNLHHCPEAIVEHFGNGSGFGLEIVYSHEPEPLGSAGGLRQLEFLFDAPFVVAYGDVLTDLDLGELVRFHRARTPAPHVTLSLYRAPNPWECGIVAVDAAHRVTRFVEKPPRGEIFSELANAGVLVMDPEALGIIPSGRSYDISGDLLPDLLRRGFPVFAQPPDNSVYLLDIGSHEKYGQAQREWPTGRMLARLRTEDCAHHSREAVFLDRDGVIVANRPDYVRSWGDVEFLPGALDALRRLTEAERPVVIVTNQAAVGRGLLSLQEAWELQSRIVAEIEAHGARVAASYLCPHRPDEGCACRKPGPGMIYRAAADLDLDLSHSVMVGDAVTDVQAGLAAGCRSVLVRSGRGRDQERLLKDEACAVVRDLNDAVEAILR